MYLSPAVRTLRDDPTPNVEARLLVRPASGADAESVGQAVREAIRDAGGTVERETRFGNLRATVDHADVAALLDALPDGVAAVETVAPAGSGDAGEDVDPDD